jgi:hypothetical protein
MVFLLIYLVTEIISFPSNSLEKYTTVIIPQHQYLEIAKLLEKINFTSC